MSNDFITAPEVAEEFTTPDRIDVFRILDIRIAVQDEAAHARALERGITSQHAYWEFELEPLSFRRVARETQEEINELYGVPRLKATKTQFDDITNKYIGLTDDEVRAVRDGGMLAIPKGKRMRYDFLDRLPPNADADTIRNVCKTPTQRQVAHMVQAGIKVTGTDVNGQPIFPEGVIGGIFEFVSKRDSFPRAGNDAVSGRFKWDESNPFQQYMRYPVQKLDEYEIPEDRGTIEVQTVWDEVEGVGGGGGGIDAEALASGRTAAGYDPAELRDLASQMVWLAENVSVAPILGISELSDAASEGNLVKFIAESLA